MTPEKLARLAVLQEWPVCPMDPGEPGHADDCEHNPAGRGRVMELAGLRRELAASPELPDDPRTLFTDESSRPNLDGSNYNDTLHAMACAEVEAVLTRVGRVAFEAAVEAVLSRR